MSSFTNNNAAPQQPSPTDTTTDLLDSVLDAVSERVVVLDAQGSIQMVNAAGVNLRETTAHCQGNSHPIPTSAPTTWQLQPKA